MDYNGEIIILELKSWKLRVINLNQNTEVILAFLLRIRRKILRCCAECSFRSLGRENQNFCQRQIWHQALYYYAGGELVFASTVKALKNSDSANYQEVFIGFYFVQFLCHSTVKNILAVPSGHYLEINSNSSPKIIKYYDLLDAF